MEKNSSPTYFVSLSAVTHARRSLPNRISLRFANNIGRSCIHGRRRNAKLSENRPESIYGECKTRSLQGRSGQTHDPGADPTLYSKRRLLPAETLFIRPLCHRRKEGWKDKRTDGRKEKGK